MDFKVLIADSAIADLKQIVEFVAEDTILRQPSDWVKSFSATR